MWVVIAWFQIRCLEVFQGPFDMRDEVLVLEEPDGDDTGCVDRIQMIERIGGFGISSNRANSAPGDLGPTIVFLEKPDHVELVIVDDFFACRVIGHDAKEFFFFHFIGGVMYAVEAAIVVFEENQELEVSVQMPGREVTLELDTEAQIR